MRLLQNRLNQEDSSIPREALHQVHGQQASFAS
jgi:hypothetical protein